MRKTKVKGVEYIQVAQYYHDLNGKRRLKILRSFGKNIIQNMLEAEIFLSNVNKVEELKAKNDSYSNDELYKMVLKISGGVLGAFIGIKIIQWLLRDET